MSYEEWRAQNLSLYDDRAFVGDYVSPTHDDAILRQTDAECPSCHNQGGAVFQDGDAESVRCAVCNQVYRP